MKHLAERKIGQPGKTGDDVNVPKDGNAVGLVQWDCHRLNDLGQGKSGKCPFRRSVTIQAAAFVHLAA